jgi:hypothetical protein
MMATVLYLREAGMVGSLLKFKPVYGRHPDEIFDAWGITPETFIPVLPLGKILEQAGVTSHLLLPKDMLRTGLSRIIHQGITHEHTHAGYTDLWMQLYHLLSSTVGERCYVSIYWPAVDSVSHLHGSHNNFLRHEVKYQLTQLRNVLRESNIQDGQTLFMLIADHGHHNADNIIDFSKDERAAPIIQALRAIGGEARFSYLYLRDGYKSAIKETIDEHFKDYFTYLEPAYALEEGLFGCDPAYAESIHRLGDLILVARLNTQLVRQYRRSNPISLHGGLSRWEMVVPLLWKTL